MEEEEKILAWVFDCTPLLVLNGSFVRINSGHRRLVSGASSF